MIEGNDKIHAPASSRTRGGKGNGNKAFYRHDVTAVDGDGIIGTGGPTHTKEITRAAAE